ncbi:MAG: capsular polysaccharide biosynthesis protein [Hyphomicrobiales bacterium]|nr:capsular polysaccharide biosynthesis protein [Hyphomicrobiales bacterium]
MNFRSAAMTGIAWSVSSQAVRMILQVVTTVVLARLLTPEDFGVYAMAIPVIALATLFQDLGLQQALIQREKITTAQINKVFWINFAVTLAIALLLVLISPLVSRFYGEERLTVLTSAWGIIMILGSLGFGQYALLGRAFRFRALAIIDMACAIAAFVTVTVLAYFWPSYWALWASGVASVACWIVLSMVVSGWRPGLPQRGVDLDGIFGFGMNVTIHNVANYASRNLDNILIGRNFGALVLGHYDRAYKLLLYPLENIAGPISRVMVPILSRMNGDPAQFRRAFLQASGIQSLICIPGMAVAIGCADELIRILLGEKWMAVAPIFYWLGFAGLIQPLIDSTGWLFFAQGRSKALMSMSVATSIVTVAAFFIGLRWGAVGVACAYAIVEYVYRVPLLFFLAGRRGSVTALDLILGVLPLLAAAGLTLLTIHFLREAQSLQGMRLIFAALPIAYGEALAVLALLPTGRRLLVSTFRLATDGMKMLRPAARQI